MRETEPDPTASQSDLDCTARLDEGALARLRELDPSGQAMLLPRIFNTYLGSLDKLMLEMHRAWQDGPDLAGIRHVAHTLKSSSASVGAAVLSNCCAEIEHCARLGLSSSWDRPDLEHRLNGMYQEAARTRAALESLLTEYQSVSQ